MHGHGQEMGIHDLPSGQTEGNIGNAQDRMAAQLIPHPAQGLQRHQGGPAVRGYGHGQAIDHDVLPGHAVTVRGFINFPGDGDPSLRCRRNALFIQDQGHQDAAVFTDQGEDSFYALLLAVDGIDHGLAVIKPHAPFQSRGICCIDLQRKGQDALQPGDHLTHHGRLINLRQAYIDVQNMGSAVLLPQAFRQNIFDIVFPQGRLELLLAGRIDPFPDDDRPGTDLHRLAEGCDHCTVFGCILPERHTGNLTDGPADMVRCCAAAAAHDLDAQGRDPLHPCGKLLRIHVIDRPAAFRSGQAGIGIDNDRNRRHLRHPLHNGEHLFRPQSAVDAQSVHPQALQHSHRRIHRAAGQELSGRVIDGSDQDRQVTVLLCRQDRSLGLIAVTHGLDQDQIRAGLRPGPDHLAEQTDRLFKGKVAHGLQKLACRTYVQGDISVLPSGPAPCLLCQLYSGPDDLLQIVRIFQRVGPEGICIENIDALFQIAAVEVYDILRSIQIPCLRQFSARQAFGLQDGSHTAVTEQPLLSQSFP